MTAGGGAQTGSWPIVGLDRVGRGDLAVVGGKAANLGELIRAGFPVPPGFVITTEAYRRFVAEAGLPTVIATASDPVDGSFTAAADRIRAAFRAATMSAELRAAIVARYDELVDDRAGTPVAVRSSATAEDLAEASFAGQQESYLNVRDTGELIAAVRDCWSSLWTEQAMAYRYRRRVPTDDVALAVVVQHLIEADASGVMFTANPANGRRDQIVLAASWGLGEAVVGGRVDTDEVILDAASHAVLSRRTPAKAVMTVLTDGAAGTVERPVPEDRVDAVVLDDRASAELAAIGSEIQGHFGRPQDIEWTLAAGRFAVVQSRPVTALPEPEGPVPTDWSTPPGSWYFRASIVEQLPDPLTPLFADLVDPAVTASLQALMDELIEEGTVRPEDVSLPTVNGYAYYRYSYGGMLRLTLRTPAALMLFVRRGDRGAIGRWRGRAHPAYQRLVERWSGRELGDVPATELRAGVAELLQAGCEYYTSVQTIIPIAATTEVLFTRFYQALVRQPGDPAAATFLLGFDSSPIRAEKSLWGLAAWARTDDRLTDWLLTADDAEVLAPADRQGSPETEEWARRFAEHLGAFGHSVYNLDFANAVPADDPAPVLATVRFYLRGEGNDPHARQQAAARRREELTIAARRRLDPVRRRVFDRLLRSAQQAAPVREDALADVGLAWPLLRRMLAELGARLVAAGAIAHPAQVFWLTAAELDGLIAADPAPTEPGELGARIAERRRIWRGRRRATPPQALPAGRVMTLMESVMPARSQQIGGSTLRGISASAGTVTAPARVLAGPEEFALMRPGEVLVASITTPAWTSLFAMASAVVTDIGGPLSHSSIVAREYGIPAVLGTGEATRRITTGQLITVDGDAGLVLLAGDDTDESDDPPPTRRAGRFLAAAGIVAFVVLLIRRLRR